MVEFLKSYGIWIFVGLLFLFMLRSHGRGAGGCCGTGGHQHNSEHNSNDEAARGEGQPKSENPHSGCH